MNLPACHSRRLLAGERKVFFCAHPRLHTPHHIVTSAVCKSCHLFAEPPPDRCRSLAACPEHLRQRSDLQLVIARFRENVHWRYHFHGVPTIVYDNGDARAENALPNIGREAHTYLHHIITHYDDLAPTTVFLQGDPHPHVPDLSEKIWKLPADPGFQDLCDHILVEDGRGEPIQPGLRLKEMYEALFGEPAPEYFVCHEAACFAVSRENVLRRPRAFNERALDLVVNRPLGPWEIERLWQCIFQTRVVKQGIVTAADAGFFRNLQWFLLSYQQWNRHPLVVLDLGLHEEQRRWCLAQPGVSLHRMPTTFAAIERIRERPWWQAWLKPFYIFHAPLDRLLWIDADCTFQGDVGPVLESIDQQPFLVRDDTIAVTENDPELYRYLTLPPNLDTRGINVNAGVVGLCKIRDRALLSAWTYAVGWAARNPDKQALSAWADQGLLLWALHRTSQTRFIRQDLAWNWPAHAFSDLLASTLRGGHSMLEEIRRRCPDAKIVHWLGVYKLARQLDAEMEQLFLHGLPLDEDRTGDLRGGGRKSTPTAPHQIPPR